MSISIENINKRRFSRNDLHANDSQLIRAKKSALLHILSISSKMEFREKEF